MPQIKVFLCEQTRQKAGGTRSLHRPAARAMAQKFFSSFFQKRTPS
jgi:hypothetical protein